MIAYVDSLIGRLHSPIGPKNSLIELEKSLIGLQNSLIEIINSLIACDITLLITFYFLKDKVIATKYRKVSLLPQKELPYINNSSQFIKPQLG